MRRSRHTASQIASILGLAEAGTPVSVLCRDHDISPATFFRWKKRYRGSFLASLDRLSDLEVELVRLHETVARQRRDIDALRRVLREKF